MTVAGAQTGPAQFCHRAYITVVAVQTAPFKFHDTNDVCLQMLICTIDNFVIL